MNIFSTVTSLTNSAFKALSDSAIKLSDSASNLLSKNYGSADAPSGPDGPSEPLVPSGSGRSDAPSGPGGSGRSGAPSGPGGSGGSGGTRASSSRRSTSTRTNSTPTTSDNIDLDDLRVNLSKEIDKLKNTTKGSDAYEKQITKICKLIDQQISQSNNAKTFSYGHIVFNSKGFFDKEKTIKSETKNSKFASLRKTEKADLYHENVLKRAINDSFPYEDSHPEIKNELDTIVQNWATKNTSQKPSFYNLLENYMFKKPSTENNIGSSFFASLGIGNLFSSPSPTQDTTPPQEQIFSKQTTPSTETEHGITASFSTEVQVFAGSPFSWGRKSQGSGSRGRSSDSGSRGSSASQGSGPGSRRRSQGSDSPPPGPVPVEASSLPETRSFRKEVLSSRKAPRGQKTRGG